MINKIINVFETVIMYISSIFALPFILIGVIIKRGLEGLWEMIKHVSFGIYERTMDIVKMLDKVKKIIWIKDI